MLSVLFTPGVREVFSRVRVPRTLSGVPGRGIFGLRPSVYLPLSFTGHAVIFLHSSHGALPNTIMAPVPFRKEGAEDYKIQGTIETGFGPADSGYEPLAKPFSFFRLLLMPFKTQFQNQAGLEPATSRL